MRGISSCFDKPIVRLDLEALKDDPLIDLGTIGLQGSPTNIYRSFTPPPKKAGMMLEGGGKDAADKLAELLAAEHLI